MYEEWSAGRIAESNFEMLTRKYQAEQEEVQEKIKTFTNAFALQKQSTENAEKWVDPVRSSFAEMQRNRLFHAGQTPCL